MKLSQLKSGGQHTVPVDLSVEDSQGKVTNETLKVVYRGLSIEEGEELDKRFQAATSEREGLVDVLCESVLAIQDENEMVTASRELWTGMDTYFLNRIFTAIKKDRQGPN